MLCGLIDQKFYHHIISEMKLRKYLRVPLPLRVNYKLEEQEEFQKGIIEDLSWGGVFLQIDSPPPSGSRLIIQIPIPEQAVRLELWGTVVRVREKEVGKPAGVGVEFDELDHESRGQIQFLVDYWVRSLLQKISK